MPRGYHDDTGEPVKGVLSRTDRDTISALRQMGWSQERLAIAYGCSISTIQSFLRGRTYGPTYEDLWRVLHQNDVTPNTDTTPARPNIE